MKVKQLSNGLIKMVLSVVEAQHIQNVIGKQYPKPTDGNGIYWALDTILCPDGRKEDTNNIVARKTKKSNIRVDLAAKQYRWVYDRLGEEPVSPENGYIYDMMDQLDGTW